MDLSSAVVPCVAAAICGNASWVFYFHRFECHMHGLLYLNTFLLSCSGGFLAYNRLYGHSPAEAAGLTSAIAASFLSGVYG